MKPTFSPSVFYDFSRKEIVIQAPRDIRERAWDIIHVDDGIVDINGGVPTQIFVAPNTGYNLATAVGIALAATYLATTKKDFATLLSMTLDQHFAEYSLYVGLEVPEYNLFSVDDQYLRDGFDYLVQSYLTGSAKNRLVNMADNAFRGLGYRVSVLQTWQLEAYDAVGRYNTTPNACNHSLVFTQNPNNLLSVFDQVVVEAESANAQIAGLRDEVSQAIKDFAVLVEVDFTLVFDTYLAIQDQIKNNSESARAISDSLDLSGVKRARLDIKQSTPAAPVAVKGK